MMSTIFAAHTHNNSIDTKYDVINWMRKHFAARTTYFAITKVSEEMRIEFITQTIKCFAWKGNSSCTSKSFAIVRSGSGAWAIANVFINIFDLYDYRQRFDCKRLTANKLNFYCNYIFTSLPRVRSYFSTLARVSDCNDATTASCSEPYSAHGK